MVAGTGLILVAVLAQPPLLNLLSLPGWWSRFFQHLALDGLLWPALVFVLALALEFALGRRVWCRFLCPQSVLLSLARRLSPVSLRVRFDRRRCVCAKGREGCLTACSLDLDPRLGQGVALACGNCGDCVTACKSRGRALSFGLGQQTARPSAHLPTQAPTQPPAQPPAQPSAQSSAQSPGGALDKRPGPG